MRYVCKHVYIILYIHNMLWRFRRVRRRNDYKTTVPGRTFIQYITYLYCYI